MIDIRDANLNLGETAYILGCGLKAINGLSLMNPDNYCFAVNRAIELDIPNNHTIWICEDDRLPEFPWFREAYSRYREITCFCGKLAEEYEPKYSFPGTDKTFRAKRFRRIKFGDYTTYGGATISSRAAQLLALLNVPNIILVGVDMMGFNHYDGSRAIFNTNDTKKGSLKWRKAGIFSDIARWISYSSKSRIYSLTSTAIDVPLIIQ
jgi:hypothetical protein